MLNENKVRAVVEYLQAEFPESKIENRYDPGSKTHSFRVLSVKGTYQAQIGVDFFNQFDASQIPARLRGFTLAEHLRELPSDVVLVTEAGLKLLGD